jgi:acetyl esterase/lipase
MRSSNAFVEDRSVLSRAAKPPDCVVRYGEIEENVADVRNGSNAERLPLVVFIHGGFWRPQFDRTHTGPLCAAIADAGWTIASIEYRRIPGNPDATVEDIAVAIPSLQRLVAAHNGTTVLAGHSAGGHLALWAAHQALPHVHGVLALGPVADLHDADARGLGSGAVQAFLGRPAAERGDLDPALLSSPTCNVTIIHGELDELVPLAISEHYRNRHMRTHLKVVPGCGHFALIDPQSVAWPHIVDELRKLSCR